MADTWKAEAYGSGALWAVGAIAVIATVYEFNAKVGLVLFALALMGLALTYQQRFGFSYERKL